MAQDHGRRQYWRAVRLAEKNAAYATMNLLKSMAGRTGIDSMLATEDILDDDDDGMEEFVAEMMGYLRVCRPINDFQVWFWNN